MTNSPGRSRGAIAKTYFVVLLFLALKAGGNFSMAWGMKHVPEQMSLDPARYLHAMANPFVAMGIIALILALLTRMALLSLADLSFVLPVTAIGYVFTVFIGKTFLHETVTKPAMAGNVAYLRGSNFGWNRSTKLLLL